MRSIKAGFLNVIIDEAVKFEIACQSPSDVVLKAFRAAIPLYCISTLHSISEYFWKMLGDEEKEFPPSCVIHVNVKEVGMFQCVVRCMDTLQSHISFLCVLSQVCIIL